MIDIELINEVDLNFDIKSVESELNDVLTKIGDSTNFSIEFLLVSEDKIQKLNNQYFHKDYPTDVLSFNYQENPELLGSIVVCVEIAQKQANEANIPLEQEITDLTVHGLLHLLDYNHK